MECSKPREAQEASEEMKQITVEEFHAIPGYGKITFHYLQWCETVGFSTERAVVLTPDEFPLDVNGERITNGVAIRLQTAIRYLFGPDYRLAARGFPDGSLALLVVKREGVAESPIRRRGRQRSQIK